MAAQSSFPQPGALFRRASFVHQTSLPRIPAARLGLVILTFPLLTLLLTACTSPAQPATSAPEIVDLNVFAASSLTAAFTEIGEHFQAAHPGVSVIFNFAGSQQLAQQIIAGAPADVFASADRLQMDAAIAAGSIAGGSEQIFAANRLVVILASGNPGQVAALQELSRPGLKLVLAAAEVPVGQYTLEFLDRASADPAFGAGYRAAVLANVVSYEDNVNAVRAKIALGEADAGIVYHSDIYGEEARRVETLDIPAALNVHAGYPIAPVLESPKSRLAQAFIDSVLSPDGQAVLEKYNFLPPE